MLYKIHVSRSLRVPPVADAAKRRTMLEIIVDNANDWTHFTHIHHKHIVRYDLLFKRGSREIFLYKSRRLHPLPFFDYFVVFRDYRPQQLGYRNVYYHIRTGSMNFLDSTVHENADGSIELIGDFVFTLPSYWRFAPRLFLAVFKRRMRGLIDEDNVLINERIRMGGFETAPCKPEVPDTYDLFEAFFGDAGLPEADVHLRDE